MTARNKKYHFSLKEWSQVNKSNDVEDYHTYCVGEQGVLVHNVCEPGVGGKGWKGDATWNGGTIPELNGGIPTQVQAENLILQEKGTLLRAEAAHIAPNPFIYSHINYMTSSGTRSAIQIVDPFIPKIY